jgi:hypothetical protein
LHAFDSRKIACDELLDIQKRLLVNIARCITVFAADHNIVQASEAAHTKTATEKEITSRLNEGHLSVSLFKTAVGESSRKGTFKAVNEELAAVEDAEQQTDICVDRP